MAGIDKASLTLTEWQELLGLDELLTDLQEGWEYPFHARQVLVEQRETYPDLPLDYVRVLDTFVTAVQEVEDAIYQQNDVLETVRSSLLEAGHFFTWDPFRLMTESERDDLERLQDQLSREAEEAEEQAEEEMLEAEELEEEALDAEAPEEIGEPDAGDTGDVIEEDDDS